MVFLFYFFFFFIFCWVGCFKDIFNSWKFSGNKISFMEFHTWFLNYIVYLFIQGILMPLPQKMLIIISDNYYTIPFFITKKSYIMLYNAIKMLYVCWMFKIMVTLMYLLWMMLLSIMYIKIVHYEYMFFLCEKVMFFMFFMFFCSFWNRIIFFTYL